MRRFGLRVDANLLNGSTPPFKDTADAIFCMSKPYVDISIHHSMTKVNTIPKNFCGRQQ